MAERARTDTRLMTVVTTRALQQRAATRMPETARQDCIMFIAAQPDNGAAMGGTRGLRKSRGAVGSRGKSGGVRVIYSDHWQADTLLCVGLTIATVFVPPPCTWRVCSLTGTFVSWGWSREGEKRRARKTNVPLWRALGRCR